MKDSLNIILGAGFSEPAGLPLVKEIDKFFNRDNRCNIIYTRSSHWRWKDCHENELNHGIRPTESLFGGQLITNLCKEYKRANGNNYINYEHFFNHLFKLNKHQLVDVYNCSKNQLKKKENISEDNLSSLPSIHEAKKLYRMMYELLEDILMICIHDEKIHHVYNKFLKYIKQYEKINIFSLNHDLVLKVLFKCSNYSDGFSSKNSCIVVGPNNTPLKIYKDVYESKGIRLFKLHGSLDTIPFEVGESHRGLYTPSGDVVHVKYSNWENVFDAKRIDIETREILQYIVSNISPYFITGLNKEQAIEDDDMYRSLYKHFNHEMATDSDLLIIGYSYSDCHINSEVKKAIQRFEPNLININPKDNFCEPRYDHKHLCSLSELEP